MTLDLFQISSIYNGPSKTEFDPKTTFSSIIIGPLDASKTTPGLITTFHQ